MESERDLQRTDEDPQAERESAAEERDAVDAAEASPAPTADEPGEGQQRPAPSAESMDEPVQALFPDEDLARHRGRWEEIQVSFVDEPRRAVEQADALVNDLLERVNAGFSEARSQLEGQWDRGEDVSTEDLRMALTRYRSFFNRLLAA
jgi:hypothetical protein